MPFLLAVCCLAAGDIEKITSISGAEANLDDLYQPTTEDAKSQLVVHFLPMKQSRRKRERTESDDSDSDEENMMRESEDPKKKLHKCSRCAKQFTKGKGQCAWHSGSYVFQFAEPNQIMPDNDTTQIMEDYTPEAHATTIEVRAWSCCGSKEQNGTGCVLGEHVVDPRGDDTLDQRLVSLFTSNAPLDPTVAPPATANQNRAHVQPARPGQRRVAHAGGDADDMDLGDQDAGDAMDVDDDPDPFQGRLRQPGAPRGPIQPQLTNLIHLLNHASCCCLNESNDHPLSSIIEPQAGVTFLQSDCDAELLITLGFHSQSRLQSITITSPRLSFAPATIKIFTNKTNIDFSNVEDQKPLQIFELDSTSYVNNQVTLQLQTAKFTLVDSIVLYISSNIGDEATTTISQIGIYGVVVHGRGR